MRLQKLEYENFISETEIISYLSRIRAAKAHQKHNKQFLRNISGKGNINLKYHEVYSLFPSRKYWVRPRKRIGKNSKEINTYSLNQSAIKLINNDEHKYKPWALKLKYFIADIQLSALSGDDIKIISPLIIPREKKKPIYRPIAEYTLKHNVLYGLTAKYFRYLFDEYFFDCCYAFRAPNDNGIKTHHDAVEEIIKYIKKYKDKPLWVAECDIKGFFDNIHHNTVKSEFNKACDCIEKNGNNIDYRAKKIFNAYLDSYSYTLYAIIKAKEWFDNHNPTGKLKNYEDDLREYWPNPSDEKIGVPQGGAISCVIANIVLHHADCAIKGMMDKNDLFYARYCDDMILIHPNKEICEKAFQQYLEALKQLKLPYHNPLDINEYPGKREKENEQNEYWTYKTKKPYKFTKKVTIGDVPWIGFVGYQIRYDSVIRIRKSSLKKEINKQIEEADNLLRVCLDSDKKGFSTKIKKSAKKIIFRFEQRLISMSIGRKPLKIYDENFTPGFCWANGYCLLKRYNIIPNQLKRLDMSREKQIRRIKKALCNLEFIDDIYDDINIGRQFYKYYGTPFSYYGQFLKKKY